MKNYAVNFLVIIFVLGISISSARAQQSASPVRTQQRPRYAVVAEEVFDFNLRGLDGKSYRLANLRGNVLLVSFGATWCQPCKEELAALRELKDEYGGRPVKFFWVNIEGDEEMPDKKLRQFVKSNKLTFPVLRDPNKLAFGQFSERVRVPMVVLFDKSGKFDTPKQTGMSTPEIYKMRMRERLDKLLLSQGSGQARASQ